MRMAMVGLGRMGANMARRLLRAGHECVVYNRNPEPVRGLTVRLADPVRRRQHLTDRQRQTRQLRPLARRRRLLRPIGKRFTSPTSTTRRRWPGCRCWGAC